MDSSPWLFERVKSASCEVEKRGQVDQESRADSLIPIKGGLDKEDSVAAAYIPRPYNFNQSEKERKKSSFHIFEESCCGSVARSFSNFMAE